MRKLFKRLLLALFLIFIFRVYSGSYDALFSDLVRSKIVQYKIPCSFDSLRVGIPFVLKIDGLGCSLPNPRVNLPPAKISFNEVGISPAWKEIFSLAPGIRVSVIPLQEKPGSISVVLSRSLRSGRSFSALDLYQFPMSSVVKSGMIPGLSIDGELSGSVTFNFSNQEDLVGEGSLLFEKGALSASGMEHAIIKLPMLKDVSISLPITSSMRSITFSPIVASSSFGALKGEASVKDFIGQASYSFNGSLLLNELGIKAVGGFVALLAGVDVSKPVEEWKISVSGDLGRPPALKITPSN